MKSGKVKFYNHEKGFGFIIEDQTGEEIFVHKSGIIDSIKENDQVSYATEQGRKGINAVDVKLA